MYGGDTEKMPIFGRESCTWGWHVQIFYPESAQILEIDLITENRWTNPIDCCAHRTQSSLHPREEANSNPWE